MSRLLRALNCVAALLLIFAMSRSLSHASAQIRTGQNPLVAIVSAQSKLQDLPKAMLKRIFLGEPTEHDGVRFLPFNYAPEDALRRSFDQQLLGFDAGEAGRYWIDRRIRGQGLPPRVVPSVAIARAAVAKLPGAICYLRVDQLDATVRALRIDGVPHTAAEYPLKP